MSGTDPSVDPPEHRPRPLWNVISVAVPLMALVIGTARITETQFGAGDYGGRLGSAILLIMGIGVGCAVGFVAAMISLFRGERWIGLAWLGLIGNGAVLIPIASLLFQE